MYFTACKPVDRNTECDALCGNREDEGEGGIEKEREVGRETVESVQRQMREETCKKEGKRERVCVRRRQKEMWPWFA